MTQQADKGKDYDPLREVVRIEAEALARGTGLDPDRVRSVLERTARDWQGRRLPDKGGFDDLERGVMFWPSLEAACYYMRPDEALWLFERADLRRLEERVVFVDYLADPGTPLYSLDELAWLTKSLISYFERNREHLVRTGYPKTTFERSSWLRAHLAKLYFVKLPVEVRTRWTANREFECSYKWPRQPPEDLGMREAPFETGLAGLTPGYMYGSRGKVYTSEGEPIEFVPYEEAALMQNLAPEKAIHLEAGRALLLDLKIRVLGELLEAVRTRRATHLWQNCLGHMTELVTADQVGFYLRMDAFYSGCDWVAGDTVAPGGYMAGGFTDLLKVIGHYEKELRIGLLARTREALSDLVRLGSLYSPRLAIHSYFEVAEQAAEMALDRAYAVFPSLQAEEEAFWSEYRTRVNRSLQGEFFVEVIHRQRVRGRVADRFEPSLRKYSDWLKARLEGTLILPESHQAGLIDLPDTLQDDGLEEEFRRYAFKSRIPLRVTGATEKGKSNVVLVGPVPVYLGEASFLRFFRLLIQLHRRPDGWAAKGTLHDEGYMPSTYYPQAVRELRREFRSALGFLRGPKPDDFIEHKHERTRLSTHTALIGCDKGRLLEHPDARIRTLARELPDAPESS